MKHSILITSFLFCAFVCFTQTGPKPPIDSAAIANWVTLSSSKASITNDGKYFMYDVGNLPQGSHSVIIQQIHGSWKKQITDIGSAYFSSDGKQAFYQNNDTLYFQKLGKEEVKLVTSVVSFKQPDEAKGNWLAYRFKNDDLILQNLLSGKNYRYASVIDYSFDKKGKVLLIKSKNQTSTESLAWINLSNGESKTFWNEGGLIASQYTFDPGSGQMVFIAQEKQNGKTFNSIWYYKEGMDKAIMKVNSQTKGIDSGMLLSNTPAFFSKNGKHIFFTIEPEPVARPKPNPNAVQVDVWSYKDLVLQENQIVGIKSGNPVIAPSRNEFICVISLTKEEVTLLGQKSLNDNIYYGPGDFIITSHKEYTGDKTWEKKANADYYIVNLKESIDRKLLTTSWSISSPIFSKSTGEIIYFDYEKRDVVVVNLLDRLISSSGKSFSSPLYQSNEYKKVFHPEINGWKGTISGWLGNTAIIIDDGYDLFKMDFNTGNLINLTNGYGRKHNLRFRIINPNDEFPKELPSYYENQPLLLTAFNSENKQNGFYKMYLQSKKDPELLSMGPYVYYTKSGQAPSDLGGMNPIKSANNEAYIVMRESASDAPEYFFTKDFKSFKQLTYYQPQKKYSWFTTELITWTKLDGKTAQGVLYKPENFDPKKKYPLILNYYETKSEALNKYLQPEIPRNEIDIPWFVSRGYFVFTPDIEYKIGEAGESVVNSVVSGARYLSTMPYIDSTKVGIQGHSWGGYETNYLVTHTNLFAAAAEGAGPTNFISNYGSLVPGGAAITIYFEKGHQNRLEKTLWESPDIYIKNSPIFEADKVTTPLLIMHNKMDGTVPWGQAVEFFIALRRLNKVVWMLQYDKGGHGVWGKKDQLDYAMRMTQFFDHYLKDVAAPKWMTQGIPATLKGVETGYDLDLKGKCSENCKVCNKIIN